ncbi:hypothetical protein TIFTF001_044865 [Ficus carica]|uniref:Uncharacterized protein n=1 Tax=Ficus carica TaxID=3494 RepID=A0AA87ZJF2_FICCA|nr:hypothetical protein TIFTF001_044865 [Ficus carica]
MGHYCRRFQEAMLPHIPQDIASPGLQALVILRNGLPPQIRQYIIEPMLVMTVGDMIADILEAEMVAHAMQADAYVVDHPVPADDAGLGEPQYEVGPIFPEDPIPAVPVQEVPAHEAEDQIDAEDAADGIVAPEDPPADPPIVDISSDDEDKDMDQEPEPERGDWVEAVDDLDDDPEEILFDDDDWDVDFDASSVVTIEIIV